MLCKLGVDAILGAGWGWVGCWAGLCWPFVGTCGCYSEASFFVQETWPPMHCIVVWPLPFLCVLSNLAAMHCTLCGLFFVAPSFFCSLCASKLATNALRCGLCPFFVSFAVQATWPPMHCTLYGLFCLALLYLLLCANKLATNAFHFVWSLLLNVYFCVQASLANNALQIVWYLLWMSNLVCKQFGK